MKRSGLSTLIVLAAILVPALGAPAEIAPFAIDWAKSELRVTGSAEIAPKETGNVVGWQYEANLAAQRDVVRRFVQSLGSLRVDAETSARDALLANAERNRNVNGYVADFRGMEAVYTDRRVEMRVAFPFYGEDGFIPLITDAGLDEGSFPEYDDFVLSAPFTGLVVDARGLGRVAAVAPRLFDEDHRVVYSIDFVTPNSFREWGCVKYTSDPYYRGDESRVGENPLRIVALENEKLIETDIMLATSDAKTLLQDDASQAALKGGRVIIIIDEAAAEVLAK